MWSTWSSDGGEGEQEKERERSGGKGVSSLLTRVVRVSVCTVLDPGTEIEVMNGVDNKLR